MIHVSELVIILMKIAQARSDQWYANIGQKESCYISATAFFLY